MIYFIVTTSIFIACDIRKSQYIYGINTLKKNKAFEYFKLQNHYY